MDRDVAIRSSQRADLCASNHVSACRLRVMVGLAAPDFLIGAGAGKLGFIAYDGGADADQSRSVKHNRCDEQVISGGRLLFKS